MMRSHEETRRALREKLSRIAQGELTATVRMLLVADAAILCDRLGDYLHELDEIVNNG